MPEKTTYEITARDNAATQHSLAAPKANTHSPSRGLTGLVRYLSEFVPADSFVEIELVLLSFVTGIQDATTFPDYHCFASNQTGNTVLLALSILNVGRGELFRPENIGTSLGCFLVGGLVIGQLGHFIGQRRRIWLVVSNLVQTFMVFAAGALQYRYGINFAGSDAVAILALLSLASGAQVVLSRGFGCPEISTAMATAAWVDLMFDRKMWDKHNHKRNRRVSFLIALFSGAFVGACMHVKMGSAFALMISGAGKAIVTTMFLFNKREDRVPGCSAAV